MTKKNSHIIILETSQIIYEGVAAILKKAPQNYNIQWVENFHSLQQVNLRLKADFVFVNPVFIQNQIKEFQSIKKEFNSTIWIGIVYTFIDQILLSEFDEIITINDSPEKIISLLERLFSTRRQTNDSSPLQETLSDGEIDVLKLLVEGNANKEIADKLNISAHTVISHRKNISLKTGIKSVAGLTIYAVVNQIITINNYRD